MKSKFLVIGAGGHARSVLDIVLQNGEYSEIACLDSSWPYRRHIEGLEAVPIIGTDSDLESLFIKGYKYIFVALGNNKIRHRLFLQAVSIGYKPVNIISQHSFISPRVSLGKGICVMAGAVVNVNSIIENNCIINTRCSIDHDCHISESCHIAPGVTLSGNVHVGEGAWIGTGTSVIDNIVVGKWSYIGSGAAVVDNTEPDMLYYGVPAKKIKPI